MKVYAVLLIIAGTLLVCTGTILAIVTTSESDRAILVLLTAACTVLVGTNIRTLVKLIRIKS